MPLSSAALSAGATPPAVGTEAVTSVEAYDVRKDRYIDALTRLRS